MSTVPYQSHSETSRMAAMEAEAAAATQRGQVFRAIRAARFAGMTDEDQQIALGMNPSTQRPRRIELVHRGLVMDSGMRRKTKAGRDATVWIATPTPPVQMDLL